MEPPVLICAQPIDSLRAGEVAHAVAGGLLGSGRPAPDVIELPLTGDVKDLLVGLDFDSRMRRAFAVIICTEHLREGELRGTLPVEIATSARQAGVACHAICAENSLSRFTARMYDLQTIREFEGVSDLQAAADTLSGDL